MDISSKYKSITKSKLTKKKQNLLDLEREKKYIWLEKTMTANGEMILAQEEKFLSRLDKNFSNQEKYGALVEFYVMCKKNYIKGEQ